jgi:hypothetical protein
MSLIINQMAGGNHLAEPASVRRWAPRWCARSGFVKTAMTAWMILALFLVGISIGRAAEREKDETVVTVQVNSADHELKEGYFALGEQATVMVKPGSELFQFLSRQRGRKVRIVLTEAAAMELSKIER